MTVRLLCHAFRQQFRLTQKQLTHNWSRNGLLNVPGNNGLFTKYRLLHVRISDKDAGLDIKRIENEAEDKLFEQLEDSTGAPEKNKLSRRGGSKTAKTNRFEVSTENDQIRRRKKDQLILNADADTFGNAQAIVENEAVDTDDDETVHPTRRTKKLNTAEYARQIKNHLNANRLKDALAVLEYRMLKEDRVKPENYIYNLLISGCAKAGYTRKAFSLFTKMRQRGLKVTGGTYTSLFNACANAPSPADGLGRAQHVREIMLEKGYEPNVINYNAMIKAYGRCGDVQTAYMLADEMQQRQLAMNADTFNFLLQACASDKEMGFRHCLLTWHKMLKRNITPDYYSFNTVLRCVRDCGFGDLKTMQQVLEQLAPQTVQSTLKLAATSDKQPTDEDNSLQTLNNDKQQLELTTNSTQLEMPNLLLPRPHLGSLVALTEITRPHDRFLLLGGITGFLELMKSHNITPDIETFTTMLDVIPPTNSAEKQLLIYIRKIGLKADIDFFNILIKKRSMRFDYESAKEVLSMIRTAGLKPDVVTYGVLALGCQTPEAARELLQQMQTAGIRMNIQILGAMLRQGCAQNAFVYVNEILQLSLDEHIKPNDIFLRHLHNFYKQCARAIDSRHPTTKSKLYKKQHSKFCDKYRLYYEEHGLTGLKLEDAINKIKERPYDQYKEADVDGLEPLKNAKYAHKQKIRKYIKKIKIENLRGDEESTVNNKLKSIE